VESGRAARAFGVTGSNVIWLSVIWLSVLAYFARAAFEVQLGPLNGLAPRRAASFLEA
jgi:hypothetical protein